MAVSFSNCLCPSRVILAVPLCTQPTSQTTSIYRRLNLGTRFFAERDLELATQGWDVPSTAATNDESEEVWLEELKQRITVYLSL